MSKAAKKRSAAAKKGWATRRAKPRTQEKDLREWFADFSRQLRIHGTYDAARTSDDMATYWVNADSYDADSANDKGVRHTLIQRSRYDTYNNGYSDGIAQTYATDLVGTGPQLRMQTNSIGFNQLVERTFFLWMQAVKFRRKFWTMAHAKDVDGEAIAVLRRNPRINHQIKLDVVLYEAEQCQTPYVPFTEPGYIDGIKFDEFGNPLWYDILREHPGASGALSIGMDPERVAADRVLHWFKLRRPGQHRGVPERASTLNLGACFRRLREANLRTAEKVAAWTLLLKTMFEPEQLQAAPPMSTLEILHGMMTALPNSVEPYQLKAEHPGPTYDGFFDRLLNEQARPKSMPKNKAACDSSQYNYASGRLDHQTYYSSLDVDREDGNDLVLDPLFNVWLDLAIATFGWLGGNPANVGPGARFHIWDWPKHRVADVEAEANANQTKLQSGQIFPHRLFSDAGLDWEDECEAAATAYGIPVEELKRRLLDTLMPQAKAPAMPSEESVAAALLNLRSRGVWSAHANGNGAHHG
jgi:hypothetical protein